MPLGAFPSVTGAVLSAEVSGAAADGAAEEASPEESAPAQPVTENASTAASAAAKNFELFFIFITLLDKIALLSFYTAGAGS